jgi:type 1 glutamine amidotransferase
MRFKINALLAIGVSCLIARGGSLKAQDGFVSMFNGQDLTGWSGSPDLWSVRDGTIVGQTTPEKPAKENTFLIWTNSRPADFEMRCSFKITANNSAGFANSGVQFRSRIVKPSYWVISGYQADMEWGPNYTGGLYEEKARGILASRGDKLTIHADGSKETTGSLGDRAELEKEIHHGDWNEYVIIAKGNHLQQFINGKEMIDVTDEQTGKAAFAGVIALQLHQGQPMKVEFKDLRIKEDAGGKKIVFVAGPPSHGPREHEYNAGCLLLQNCLNYVPGVQTVVYQNGWPKSPDAFDGADAVVLSMDGGESHPMLKGGNLQQLAALMDKGVGLAAIHYAVEPTKNNGEKEFLDWMGGAFETDWSVNPTWKANFATLPDNPITRGVKPFEIRDEWYFHMRFTDGMRGVTPILSAIAPESTMDRKDGPHEGNPAVREAVKNGEPAIVCWAFERPNGGRGFGFTGAHYHDNYGDDNFRKIVLNGILWIAKVEVPSDGVDSPMSKADLDQNLDPKHR